MLLLELTAPKYDVCALFSAPLHRKTSTPLATDGLKFTQAHLRFSLTLSPELPRRNSGTGSACHDDDSNELFD